MFFKRRKTTKLYFTTDIHGSEKCWKKLIQAGDFYEVKTIILGGDITGKGIQALLEIRPSCWRTDFLGERIEVTGEEALEQLEDRVRAAGFYPYRLRPSELEEFTESEEHREQIFQELMTQSINRWLDMAETQLRGKGQRIIITAGNDDPLFIDNLLGQSSVVVMAEQQVLQLNGNHEMVNEGYTNPTPWNTHRELDEDSLYEVLKEQIEQVHDVSSAIFNIHAPPYNSKLDDAPLLDDNLVPVDGGRTYVPVGSTSVRRVIEEYQPLLGLHGHIHEAKGSLHIGRTLCVNPGSNYTEGVLSGYLFYLDENQIRGFQPVQG